MKRGEGVRYYFVLFLEGVITFISPCLLPMLPVYVSYFAGTGGGRAKTALNACCFVAGFTIVFTVMGAFAGTVGMLLREYKFAVNTVSGIVVVILGLNFLGLLKLRRILPLETQSEGGGEVKTGAAASAMLGITFAVLWTPCVGAFLGSALMMASNQDSAIRGSSMLLCYSAGLGIPFVVSALLIDMSKSVFSVIKRNYRIINSVSGALLIIVGILIMTGYYGRIVT
jgi:cytochrome c-type biogenesis protein